VRGWGEAGRNTILLEIFANELNIALTPQYLSCDRVTAFSTLDSSAQK